MSVLKNCKSCKKEFNQYNSIQKLCFDCTVLKAKETVKKDTDKSWRKNKSEYRESNTDYFKLLQNEVNKIARLIDHEQLCISCQKVPKKINGCHFKSVGGHKSLRYNLFNIYSGCEKCNSELGGNVHGYDDGLIQEFGKEFWNYLKFEFLKDFPILQMKKEEAKEKLKIARQISKELENNLIKRYAKDRLEMRKIINQRLGIYNEIMYFKVV